MKGWKEIIGTVAPTLATALGGPLAGVATQAISAALLGKADGSEDEIAAAFSVGGADALQKARDADARTILAAELKKDEEALAQMRTEFNGGQPDKRGDEAKNHQKYLDRVAAMQAAITRKEADIAALKREMAKLPN